MVTSLIIIAVPTLVAGWVGLLIGVLVAIAVLRLRSVRAWLSVSSAAILATGAAWLRGNEDRLGMVTPALVTDNPVPHYVAVAALTALVAAFALTPPRRRG